MTAIAAVIHDGQIYMGADTLISSGGRGPQNTRHEGKIWRSGDMLLGSAGGLREAQVVQYGFNPPPLSEGQNLMAYLCTDFSDALRSAHRDAGTLKRHDGQEYAEIELVIGWRGRLFVISDWFSVSEFPEFAGTGSGGETACAVLHATPDLEPGERLKRALEAAEYFCEGVRAPFTYLDSL